MLIFKIFNATFIGNSFLTDAFLFVKRSKPKMHRIKLLSLVIIY
jgi:hypothetical protein